MHNLDAIRFIPERDALDEITHRYGLGPIIAEFEHSGVLTSMREEVLGTQLHLSRALSPRLFSILQEVRKAINFEEPIDLFIKPDASLNAGIIHSLDRTPHIMSLTSALVGRMNDAELRFVLGHEIGHLHYEHYRAKLGAQAVERMETVTSVWV